MGVTEIYKLRHDEDCYEFGLPCEACYTESKDSISACGDRFSYNRPCCKECFTIFIRLSSDLPGGWGEFKEIMHKRPDVKARKGVLMLEGEWE